MRTDILMMATLTATLLANQAWADDDASLPGGQIETADGATLPLLSSDAEVTVTGDIASVRVTQRFANDRTTGLNARYVFPLPHDAAVHKMVMRIGDETIQAQIKRKAEAQKTFDEAKAAGKTASLLKQHRANVFTQDVANIPAGEIVELTIHYAQSVPREDGLFRLHFPMVVASRYDNGTNGTKVPHLQQPLPKGVLHRDDPRRNPDKANRRRRVSVTTTLDMGAPITVLQSPSHAIEVDELGAGGRRVMLAQGRVVDEKDFVLEYSIAKEETAVGFTAHEDERGGFFSLLVEPPKALRKERVRSREVVFVLDASGSMAGAPLDAGIQMILQMLEDLRPNDVFRIILFGSEAHQLQRKPVPPTAESLEKARHFLSTRLTMGGTEIELGIKAALDPKPTRNRMRMVVFITDGFIGDEASVLATIAKRRGQARIFAFGVGNSVNRYLIEEMAVAGRGVSRVVTLGQDYQRAAEEFAERLRTPYLTDAWIDWGNLDVNEVTPSGLFDLYAGAPVRVMGRLPSKGFKAGTTAAVVGKMGGRSVRLPFRLERRANRQVEAIAVLWARAQVARRMRALSRPSRGPDTAAENQLLVDEITELGLTFAITTRWTSFVSVSETKVEKPSTEARVALGQPAEPSRSYSGGSFPGSSAPEPATWLAMGALAAAATAASRRRGRRRRNTTPDS